LYKKRKEKILWQEEAVDKMYVRRCEGKRLSWKDQQISFMCAIGILFYNDFIKWSRNSELSLTEITTYP
jgi:hypothetical protein